MRARSEVHASALASIASQNKWERQPERTFGSARGIYLMLPDGTRLWNGGSEFVPMDRARIAEALAA